MSIQNNNSWNKKNYISTSILRILLKFKKKKEKKKDTCIIKIELNHRIGFNNDTVQH